MICSNCGKSNFRNAKLFDVIIFPDAGEYKELFQAYACLNCGKVELFMPEDWGEKVLAAEKEAEKLKMQEEERKNEENQLIERMKELEAFLQDENNTLKELKEAQKELTSIQDKLNVKNRIIYFKV